MPLTGTLRVKNQHKILKIVRGASPPNPPAGAFAHKPPVGVAPPDLSRSSIGGLRATSIAKQVALSLASLQIVIPLPKILATPLYYYINILILK